MCIISKNTFSVILLSIILKLLFLFDDNIYLILYYEKNWNIPEINLEDSFVAIKKYL
jgi:hypothetical protein